MRCETFALEVCLVAAVPHTMWEGVEDHDFDEVADEVPRLADT